MQHKPGNEDRVEVGENKAEDGNGQYRITAMAVGKLGVAG
jgi:hypothetical protein